MADLRQICIEGFCADVPEYTAGSNIAITGTDPKIISADLSGYYNKTEIDDIVSAIEVGGFKEVDTLPQTGEPNYIYLVPKQDGGYERYIYSGGQWLDLGDTDTVYSAGTNIEITNANVINSKIQSGTNITVASDGKVNLNNSPALTGTPTAPTNGTASTSNTQIATTAFVQNAINRRLPKSQNVSASITTAYAVANQTWVSRDLWTAPSAGMVICTVQPAFAVNATGQRYGRVTIGGGQTGCGFVIPTAPSGPTQIAIPVMRRISSGQKLALEVYHNAGASLNITAVYAYGFFIPD